MIGRDRGEFGLSKDINTMISALPELNNVRAVSQVSWPLVDIKFMRVKYVCNVADIYLYKIEDSAVQAAVLRTCTCTYGYISMNAI